MSQSLLDVSTQGGYDVACALRGPDISLRGLKWVLTARLRCLVGVSMNLGGDIRDARVPSLVAQAMYRQANEDIEFIKHLASVVSRASNYLALYDPDRPMNIWWVVQRGVLHWLSHVLRALDHLAEPEEAGELRTLVIYLTTCKWEKAKQQLNAIVVAYAGEKSIEQMELDRR